MVGTLSNSVPSRWKRRALAIALPFSWRMAMQWYFQSYLHVQYVDPLFLQLLWCIPHWSPVQLAASSKFFFFSFPFFFFSLFLFFFLFFFSFFFFFIFFFSFSFGWKQLLIFIVILNKRICGYSQGRLCSWQGGHTHSIHTPSLCLCPSAASRSCEI